MQRPLTAAAAAAAAAATAATAAAVAAATTAVAAIAQRIYFVTYCTILRVYKHDHQSTSSITRFTGRIAFGL